MEYNTGIAADSTFSSFRSALEYVFELAKSKRIVLPSTAVRRALAERLFYDDEEAGRDRITVTHEPGDPVWTAVSGPDGTGAVHVTVLEDSSK